MVRCLRLLSVLSVLPVLASCATPLRAQEGPAAVATVSPSLLALLRSHVKHVFIIYQENRSFDVYFGSFPGADNLATPQARTHGFREYDAIGRQWVEPFRVAEPDVADDDHARAALVAKTDGGRMDRFVAAQESESLAYGDSRRAAQIAALGTMAYQDCDTIPYYWQWARNFTLFDHFFQAMEGPSTPGNIEIIAAQTGLTQLERHPSERVSFRRPQRGEPVIDDLDPAFGPYASGSRPRSVQYSQTYATVLLTLAGRQAREARADGADIRNDVALLEERAHAPIPWGWYQEGFAAAERGHSDAYVTHHDAVQYFGYLRNNAYFWQHVHDVRSLLPAIRAGTLGRRSVIFVKGGYENGFGWRPANSNPYVQANFRGDDDHPGYSDSQISEAMAATFVNAVAHSKYWKDSVILIVWDDSDGMYDHVPPPRFERCADGHPCGDGPRVPAILISPYARDRAIVSVQSDHTSVAKFLAALFGLPPLATLPDEARYMPEGPRDANPALSDLTAAFDPARLAGTRAPIPPSSAFVRDVSVPPHASCATLGIHPAAVPGLARPPNGYAPFTDER
jgi:phospholipase C